MDRNSSMLYRRSMKIMHTLGATLVRCWFSFLISIVSATLLLSANSYAAQADKAAPNIHSTHDTHDLSGIWNALRGPYDVASFNCADAFSATPRLERYRRRLPGQPGIR